MTLLKDILECTQQELSDILVDKKLFYISYPIKKRNKKKKRYIDAPQGRLKEIQNNILKNLLYKFSAHPVACGFTKRKGVIDGALKHTNKKLLINVDIYNFFGSLNKEQIERLFTYLLKSHKFKNINSSTNITVLTELVTYKSRLPQGAPTSPILSNLSCLGIDKRLKELAGQFNCDVSRYADDISFSTNDTSIPISKLISAIKRILMTKGLKLNFEKTKVMKSNRRQKVTGIVVNEKLNSPRNSWRNLRACLHNLKTQKKALDLETYQKLRGQVEWVSLLNKSRGDQLLQQLLLVCPTVPQETVGLAEEVLCE